MNKSSTEIMPSAPPSDKPAAANPTPNPLFQQMEECELPTEVQWGYPAGDEEWQPTP
ncbi:hypothetical protein GCM10007417_02030 [Glycocaulis alkaliphilus]|nr:hypothetical protein GCM10007417_02030 [Glycocaulis alkaliphilus]